MHELDCDMARVRTRGGRAGQRDQPAAPREPLGHPVAQAGQPLAFGPEESLVGLGTLLEHAVKLLVAAVGEDDAVHSSATSRRRLATPSSHSRHPSTPSPVRALTSIRSTPGLTWSR